MICPDPWRCPPPLRLRGPASRLKQTGLYIVFFAIELPFPARNPQKSAISAPAGQHKRRQAVYNFPDCPRRTAARMPRRGRGAGGAAFGMRREMSRFVMIAPSRSGHPAIQTCLCTVFFCTRSACPGHGTTPGRPPKTQFCSYNVLMRMSSAMLRRRRPGSDLRSPLLKRQRRARRERVCRSGSPEGGGDVPRDEGPRRDIDAER